MLSYVAAIAFLLLIISFITYKAKKIPVIDSISPAVGSPGDTMVIKGSNFGSTRGTNYVEIGGNRITASNYLVWDDNLIKIILPSNVQDGLILVSTKNGKSKPGFFANKEEIPVAVPPDTKTFLPVISTVQGSSNHCGSLITIFGSNFGTTRGKSLVYFSAARDDAEEKASDGFDTQYIPASERDFDYNYWSDSEIKVRIPEGATSGNLYVETEKGKSKFFHTDITLPAGEKLYSLRKTYVVQLTADIESLNSKTGTNITLRIPRPIEYARQPEVQLSECSPAPVIENFRDTIIHQLELPKSGSQEKKYTFSSNFIITTYSVHTSVNEKLVKPYTEKSRLLYKAATAEDSLIHPSDPVISAFAKKAVGKESNPYVQAKLIYDSMIENFALQSTLNSADRNPTTLITKRSGDAYEFAIVYTASLRSLGIPAYPMGGILVDSNLKTTNHWWCEFYIENFGWIPVDVSLGTGASYKSFRHVDSPKDFYFGNLDGQHIAFSRGLNEIKQATGQNSKIVRRPKTYALQTIWEESSEGNVNYSSLWNDPVVIGVY